MTRAGTARCQPELPVVAAAEGALVRRTGLDGTTTHPGGPSLGAVTGVVDLSERTTEDVELVDAGENRR